MPKPSNPAGFTGMPPLQQPLTLTLPFGASDDDVAYCQRRDSQMARFLTTLGTLMAFHLIRCQAAEC